MQTLAEAHDTPVRTPYVVPVGLGVRLIVQLVPFHASENALFVDVPPNPTAMHLVAERHDTLSRALSPAGRGVALTLQALPFHASARGRLPPGWDFVAYPPTAMQAWDELHDTA